jgi:cytochrome b
VRTSAPEPVYVWDWPLRACHWALVLFVIIAWFTPNTWDGLHRFAGYTVLGLITFRLVWGFLGNRHSRFRSLPRRLRAAPRYVRDILHGNTGRYRGLNPAGAAMLIALLLALSISAITGAMQVTERYFGIWWVEDTHEYSSDATMVLVLIHVLGVLWMCIRQGENLVRSMVTGWKRR